MAQAIRHAEPEDAPGVHRILTQKHVLDGTMRLPYQDLAQTRTRMSPQRGTFQLVSIEKDEIVGFSELITYPDLPRHRHVGEINIIVTHERAQGRGIGRGLMQAMIDMADTWLQIKRLGLVVYTNNDKAIRLYESFGFTIEGTMPAYAIGRNGYLDAYKMGRVIT